MVTSRYNDSFTRAPSAVRSLAPGPVSLTATDGERSRRVVGFRPAVAEAAGQCTLACSSADESGRNSGPRSTAQKQKCLSRSIVKDRKWRKA